MGYPCHLMEEHLQEVCEYLHQLCVILDLIGSTFERQNKHQEPDVDPYELIVSVNKA